MKLHDSKSLYTKVLEVKHNLAEQAIITGRGRGEYIMVLGEPPVHPVIHEMIKLDIVWRIDVGPGYIMVTASQPERWPEIEGKIVHIAARHIDEGENVINS